MTGIHELLNRPMLLSDLAEQEHGRWPGAIRDLVRQYRRASLPVLNGSLGTPANGELISAIDWKTSGLISAPQDATGAPASWPTTAATER